MPQQRGRGARTLSKKQQWRMLCVRRCAKHDAKSPSPPAPEGHAPARLLAGAAREILSADSAEGSEDGSDTDGFEDDRRRSVSFDETARVMLVPTRHELLELGHGGGGEDTDGDAGGREEGLWWTRKDCNQFRRSFRRQIFAQGLQKSCTTLLMKDKMVYKIGRDEEESEERDDADAAAGGTYGDGRSGTCSASCGGTELSPSPSPILAAGVQDFV